MKKLIVILFLFLSCDDPSNNALKMRQFRAQKDEAFKQGKTSPLNEHEKINFKGLEYFDYDDAFRVEAKLSLNDSSPIFPIPTTKGTKKYFKYIGDLNFEINGEKLSLRALKAMAYESDYYFVPFKDKTTGETSYYTGRYMEVHQAENGNYIIDFNAAYNPWCNYSDNYNCPIPISFNKLDIAVTAGEKIYNH